MNYHVEVRKITDRDWQWLVRGWLGDTAESGHAKFKKEALEDGRSAKRFLLAQLKKMQKNGAPKKKKIWPTGKVKQPWANQGYTGALIKRLKAKRHG
jgi:hypothetical protein